MLGERRRKLLVFLSFGFWLAFLPVACRWACFRRNSEVFALEAVFGRAVSTVRGRWTAFCVCCVCVFACITACALRVGYIFRKESCQTAFLFVVEHKRKQHTGGYR